MKKNYINLCRPSNKDVFNEFKKNKKICNLEFEEQEEYKYGIYYWIRMIFNPIGLDDLLLSSSEFDIDDFLWSENYNNTEIDFIWTNNTKTNEPNISFVKFFDIDLSETEISDYAKNMYDMIDEVYKLREDFEIYNKNKTLNKNEKYEQIDKIEKILQSVSDQHEESIKKSDDSWNIKDIKFNIYFYFPASSNSYNDKQSDKNSVSEKIESYIKKRPKKNSSVQFKKENIIIEDELTDIYYENTSNVLLVSKGQIEIDKEKNWCHYSNKDQKMESYICNVSAKSIKKLWEEHKNKLLGMNLRLHIKNKNVDEEIKSSIEKNDGLFWFKNNGLLIISDSIEFSKNKINLEHFSIINGGQTTFSIGNSDFDKDFFLTCKIIVMEGLKDEEGNEKIHELSTEISLSTNNQKPIKKTDKISSISSCRILKQDLWKKELFLEIRRGDKPFKKIKPWQKIKAETLQQIYYAFFELSPGRARLKTDVLFKEENLKESFEKMRKMSSVVIIDLIKFWFILNENSKKRNIDKINLEHIQDENELKLYKKQFVTYFKFFSIFVLFILLLMYKNEEFRNWMKNKKSYFEEEYTSEGRKKKDWVFEILNYWNQTNIEKIFKFDDLERMKSKWDGFIHKNMNIIFFKNIKEKNGEKVDSWTNFTKIDINILPVLINIIDNYNKIENELGSLF